MRDGIRWFGPALALMAGLVLSACGGGSEAPRPHQAQAAAQALGARALMSPISGGAPSVSMEEAAQQLFEFAEIYYPQYFPGSPPTATALGYLYRHYPQTGVYLGLKDGKVYVMGGSFGTEPTGGWELSSFFTPRANTASQVCATESGFSTYASPQPLVGKAASLSVAGCGGQILSVQWRQTGGPGVSLPAERNQVLSFEPTSAGRHSFSLSYIDAIGILRSETLHMDVAEADPSKAQLALRAHQAVRMGSKVSVRAWPTLPAGDQIKAIRWTQLEGPTVTLDTRDPQIAFFDAPFYVSRDTLIRLRATLYTEKGQVDSDEVSVLVEYYPQAAPIDTAALWAGDHISRTYPYKSSSPYAAVLRRCSYDPAMYYTGSRYNLCSLSTLPFLAQSTGERTPSVEEVMDRVLVSHDWQGRNFEAFLRTYDTQGDLRRMLKSVTAIVISSHIRPSFYYGATGAIYLDADNFWLNQPERDTINEAPDYRSGFGSELQFDTLWRYVKDNQRFYRYYDPAQRISRGLDEVRNDAIALMYHELGHALDYLPPAEYGRLNNSQGVWENIAPRAAADQLTSDLISNQFPLTSQALKSLADVLFRGATATAEQKAYTPLQIAGFFSADLATDDYAYSTPREDTAMTLEEFLMQRRQGVLRDFAISDPIAAGATSSTIIVRWGQRGRIGEPSIRPRARAIVQALTPWANPSEVDLLPAPIQMRAGESWAANLSQPSLSPRKQALTALPTLHEWQQMKAEMRRMQRHGDGHGKRLPPLPGQSQNH